MKNIGNEAFIPELLAPAGNFERLITALSFGADAVYLGMRRMSLRNFADNFSLDELHEACLLAHKQNKRVYVAVNAFARNADLKELPLFLKDIADACPDALIINDPGIFLIVKERLPDMALHLSTQANTLNAKAAAFWHAQGIKRIVLARELSLKEIKEIKTQTPESLELEMFVHGAMCISYSGRCLLSNYINGRDCYSGECAQPCRWSYELRETGADGHYYPVEQDEKGTYFLNSRDLNLLPHLYEVIRSGVSSLKIEGRMKSIYYVAGVVNAYRMALDALRTIARKNEILNFPEPALLDELNKVSHRPYTSGFAFEEEQQVKQSYVSTQYEQTHILCAMVLQYDHNDKKALIEQRNKFVAGDELEILSPGSINRRTIVSQMETEEGVEVTVAPHPQQRLLISIEEPVKPGDLLRKKV